MTTPNRFEKMSKRSEWLTLDWLRINGLDDLAFHIEHEIDLYDEGDHHATLRTKKQVHRAKMLLAEVRIQEQLEM